MSTSRGRPHRAVVWSFGLWLASFPLMLVYLLLVGLVARALGVDLGSETDAAAELALNLVYLVLVLATLGAAAAVGFRGWRRGGHRLALVAALLSCFTALVFVFLPTL